jgi:phosphoglycolate phosphatase
MDYASFVPSRYRLHVFDLDGTLVDSLEDLYLSVNWILARRGYAPVDRETVRRAIGNGARNLLKRAFAASVSVTAASADGSACGVSAAVAAASATHAKSSAGYPSSVPDDSAFDVILAEYREYYDAHCIDHTRLYPGMAEWLEAIADRGGVSAVLTNKPEKATRLLLSSLVIESKFAVIAGPETFGALKPDPAGLLAIMRAAGAAPEETIMIGDSVVDVETARNAGVAACGITGGLGDERSLVGSKPDILIERKE